jgi:hypothetical protein
MREHQAGSGPEDGQSAEKVQRGLGFEAHAGTPAYASATALPALLRSIRDDADASYPQPLVARRMLALQRTHGNQYVQSLAQRAVRDANRVAATRAETAKGRVSRAQHILRLHVQRERQAKKRQDVALLLSDDLDAQASALAPGGKLIRVKSPEAMARALKRFRAPIKTLFVISHALPSGDLGFESGSSIRYVRPATLAAALKGSVPAARAPQLLDFRGCTIGQDPKAMDQLRAALGAGAAVGGNCYLVTQTMGPIELNGKRITRRNQVKASNRAQFEQGLKMVVAKFGRAKHAILDTSSDAYFRAGGQLVAQWFNPTLSTAWDARKSKPYKALTAVTVDPAKAVKGQFDPGLAGHCQLIMVKSGPVK